MVTPTGTAAVPGEPATWALLASARRRTVLTVLATDSPASLERLTEAVLEDEGAGDPSGDRRTEVAVDLAHVHLPKLEAADAVTYDAEERVVTREVHPIHDVPVVRPDVDAAPSEAICEALADERRQLVLSVLREQESLLVDALAERVVARKRDCERAAVPDERVQSCLASLHHADLPLLANAGLIAWSPEEGRASAVADLPDPLAVEDEAGWTSIAIRPES